MQGSAFIASNAIPDDRGVICNQSLSKICGIADKLSEG